MAFFLLLANGVIYHVVCYYFQTLSRSSTIVDVCGRPAEALPIFAMVIEYLNDHMLGAIAKQDVELAETEVEYVLTVPAIWEDKAKQFMREAAMMVGKPDTILRYTSSLILKGFHTYRLSFVSSVVSVVGGVVLFLCFCFVVRAFHNFSIKVV